MRVIREQIITEGINEVKANYPNIPDEIFYQLIALDPTYKEGKDSIGTYGKWILNLYNKHRLKEEDFYKVPELLTEFEQKKRGFSNKDINQFKTLPDLSTALQSVEVQLTDRQQLRQRQNKIRQSMSDAEIVFEDSDWTVYVPKTYEASCKLGQGTRWCTASNSNDHWYNMYSEEGNLYILISKKDPTTKYQFHFPSKQFMNASDRMIKVVDVIGNDDALLKFFGEIALNQLKDDDIDVSGTTAESSSDVIQLKDLDIDRMVDVWYDSNPYKNDLVDRDLVSAYLYGMGSAEYDTIWERCNDWGWESESYYFDDKSIVYYANKISDDNISKMAELAGVTTEQMKRLLSFDYDSEDDAEEDGIDYDTFDKVMRAYHDATSDAITDGYEKTLSDFLSDELSVLQDVEGVLWTKKEYGDDYSVIPLAPMKVSNSEDNPERAKYVQALNVAQNMSQDDDVEYSEMFYVTDDPRHAEILYNWGDLFNPVPPRYGFDPDINVDYLSESLLSRLSDEF